MHFPVHVRRRGRWLVFVVASAALLIAACGLPDGEYFGKVEENPDPTVLRYCNSGEPEYLDPALVTSTTGLKIVYAMFDGLTDHNLQGLPEPSIAKSWDISDDQRTFTFHLRDNAKWSNGRKLDSSDFAYHISRVLHPLTGSKNAETHWKLKNGELYTANRVRRVISDGGPLPKGTIVEIVGLDGKTADDIRTTTFPDSNVRTSNTALALRDPGATVADAYATVPAGEEVTVVEIGGPDGKWAYVHWADEDGVYGWVMVDKLTGQPNAEVQYTVRPIEEAHVPTDELPPVPKPEPLPPPTGDSKTAVGPLPPAKEDAPPAQPPADEVVPVEKKQRKTVVIAGRDLLMTPDVLGIRTPDPHTLILETWGPVPYMIDMSPQRAFRPSPREAVSRRPKRWVKPEHIVTSGAFTLDVWIERDRITLRKSDSYWDREHIKLERIIIYSMNDQAASANYYLQGGCHAVTSNNIPSSYFPVLNGEKRGGRRYKDYTSAPYLGIYIYLVNTKKFPNVHYRRALSYSIDRSPIPNILHGGQIPTAQFMPGTPISQLSDEDLELCGVERDTPGIAAIVVSGKLCYTPPQGLDFNLEKAKQELEIARKELGSDFKDGFTIKFNSGVEGHKLIAEWLQQEWTIKLGLEIKLESQEWKTFLKDTVAGEYDIARMGWIGNFADPEGEFLPQFKCDSPDNRTKFCDPEFERFFKLAESTPDRKKRLEYIKQAEKIMVESAPILPLYVYTQHHLQKPFVKDLAINPTDQQPLRKAWIDPDWRRNAAVKK